MRRRPADEIASHLRDALGDLRSAHVAGDEAAWGRAWDRAHAVALGLMGARRLTDVTSYLRSRAEWSRSS